MKIKEGFVIRQVGGEYVVVPVGARSKEFHGMINLNATGALLWNFFSQEHTLNEGVDALCNQYEVERTIAEKDVKAFMDIVANNGFIE